MVNHTYDDQDRGETRVEQGLGPMYSSTERERLVPRNVGEAVSAAANARTGLGALGGVSQPSYEDLIIENAKLRSRIETLNMQLNTIRSIASY